MQDRFKFRYVFVKDFGGKTGICYKMPIFNLDTITDENFNKIVKSYIDYNYKLISIEQSTGLQDRQGKLIFEGDIVRSNEYPFMSKEQDNYYAKICWDDESAGFFYYTFKNSKFNDVSGISNGNTGNLDEYEWEVIGNIYENPDLLK